MEKGVNSDLIVAKEAQDSIRPKDISNNEKQYLKNMGRNSFQLNIIILHRIFYLFGGQKSPCTSFFHIIK